MKKVVDYLANYAIIYFVRMEMRFPW